MIVLESKIILYVLPLSFAFHLEKYIVPEGNNGILKKKKKKRVGFIGN